MAKYIDRNLLPQFQLYHSYAEEGHEWNVDMCEHGNTYISIAEGLGCYKLNENDIDPNNFGAMIDSLVAGDDKQVRMVENTLRSKEMKNTIWVCEQLVKGIIKEPKYSSKWIERVKQLKENASGHNKMMLGYYVLALDNIYEFFDILQLAQGFPKQGMNETLIIPKLLLLDADLYNKCKEKEHLKTDYDALFSMPKDQAVVIVINGESAEKRMVFVMFNNGDFIKAFMIDPMNGVSDFYIDHDESNEGQIVITGDNDHCHPRGDYLCEECIGKVKRERKKNDSNSIHNYICNYSNNSHNCQHKIMKCIAAVAYCYAEYRKKLLNKQIDDNQPKHESARDKDKTQPFVPQNAVKIYDIKMTDEELIMANKYARYNHIGSHYTSSEKCPHTRRGTWRYNPKTGLKDIKVKGSVIHKDRYTGFSSAERFKE